MGFYLYIWVLTLKLSTKNELRYTIQTFENIYYFYIILNSTSNIQQLINVCSTQIIIQCDDN